MTEPVDGSTEAAADGAAPETAETAASESPAEPESEAAEDDPAPTEASAKRGRKRGRDRTAARTKEPSAARKWLARNKTAVSVIAAAGSFVVAGAFAGAAVQPYLVDRATVATKMKIAQTAANAISSLWSYTPDDMDKLSERSSKYLGGDFEEQYRKYVDAIAATNKQAKVTSTTQVVGAAVESLRGGAGGTEATAIVYTNTTSTTPQSNNIPAIKYLSYRLDLKRYGRDWRVTKMTTITSLDLTPKFGP